MSYKVVKINNVYKVPKINNVYKVVYEAEVTPPTPTGPVFDLYPNDYDTSLGNWSDKDAFLRGENVSLMLYPRSGYSVGVNLICDDWTDVAKIKISSTSSWNTSNIGYYDKLYQWQTISATVSNNIITIPLTSYIRGRITRLWAGSTAVDSGTFSNFTVYDDNNNIIIPAS